MPSPNIPASENKYGQGWSSVQAFVDLECPSGTWCQVRRPNPKQLVSLGFMDNFDTLTALIDKKHVKRVKGKIVPNVESLMKNPKGVMDAMALADKIAEHSVMQPTLKRPVKNLFDENGKMVLDDDGKPVEVILEGHERNPATIYTDMIDDIDKMYIMQFACGGSADLATFREQLGELDVNLGDVDEVASPAE